MQDQPTAINIYNNEIEAAPMGIGLVLSPSDVLKRHLQEHPISVLLPVDNLQAAIDVAHKHNGAVILGKGEVPVALRRPAPASSVPDHIRSAGTAT